MSTRPVSLDCIDSLTQIRDELQVVWCALTNPHHGEECVVPVAEHISSLRKRLEANIKAMSGKAVAQ